MTPVIPSALIEEIDAGRCIAFVGAGFSGAAKLPDWKKLLLLLAKEVGPELREHVEALLRDNPSSNAYEEAAQVLSDELDREELVGHLRRLLGTPEETPALAKRRDWLRGIPFKAILTTNFDGVLTGSIRDENAYRLVLRPEPRRWWDPVYWRESASRGSVIKIHGDVMDSRSVVFTRRDYREVLHREVALRAFLRAVFANHTILYLGFSFADAYLNELRSETLALFGQDAQHASLAYAVMSDIAPRTREHYRKHEGIEVLHYDSEDGSPSHSGFDRWLEAIHERTNPLLRFSRVLASKRILWLDKHPDNNSDARVFLMNAAAAGGGTCVIEEVTTADEAMRRLRSGSHDLVISHWGEGDAKDDAGARMPAGLRLLTEIRRHAVECPAIIFASDADASRRKRAALANGAAGYCYSYDGFVSTLERVLGDGTETAGTSTS